MMTHETKNFLLVCALAAALLGAFRVPARADKKPKTPPTRNATRQFAKHVRSWKELKRDQIVMQRRDYSCGAAALATLVKYYWGDDRGEEYFLAALGDLLTKEEMTDRIKNGLAMSDLRRVAVKKGYKAVVGKLTFEKLMDVKVPVVVAISPGGYNHFVVYRGVDGYWAYLADPIRGNIRIPISEFIDQWQENAVLAVHKPGEKVKEISPLAITESEMRLGELNWQLVRTQHAKQSPLPVQSIRP